VRITSSLQRWRQARGVEDDIFRAVELIVGFSSEYVQCRPLLSITEPPFLGTYEKSSLFILTLGPLVLSRQYTQGVSPRLHVLLFAIDSILERDDDIHALVR